MSNEGKPHLLARTLTQIEDQRGRCIEHPQAFGGMSYAEGVDAALSWVLGEVNDEPMPLEGLQD